MSSENESVCPPPGFEKCALVLVDVAGTTTSINFVKDTLFPYVTQQIETFLKGKWDEEPVKECIQLIKEEGSDLDISAAVEKIKTLTTEESSNKGLKTLQGLIYKEGYEKGDLKAHIFDDVPESLESWTKNRRVAIYSTGSVDAQKLLFTHTIHGDVTAHIHKYFDQTIGPKTESDSYKAIAKDVEVTPEEIVFVTDDLKEATAAKSAGVTAVLIKREGNAEFTEGAEKEFMVISSFKDLGLDKAGKRKIEEAAAEEAPPSKIPKTDAAEVVEAEPSTGKKNEEKVESMEVDTPTVEEKKTEETENTSEKKPTPEETDKPSEKEPEKTEKEIKDDDTEMKEEKMEVVVDKTTKEEKAQEIASKTEVVEEKKETKEAVKEISATTEEKSKEKMQTEKNEEMQTEETKTAETRVEEVKPEETKEKMEETKVTEKTTKEESKLPEETRKEETKPAEGTTKEETKLPEEKGTQKADGVKETSVEKTKVVEETAKATVDEPQTSQDKPEEKEEPKVEVPKVASEEKKAEELAKTEETKPADEKQPVEEKPAENGEEKREEAETSNKVEEKENKSVLANGVENGKDESEVDNTPGESAEVKTEDDKSDETDVRVKKLEESAESKTVSVEV